MGGIGKLKGWRRPEVSAPGSDLSSMERLDLIDVTLVTEAAGAPYEVPNLSLRFGASGFEVRRRDGESVVEIPWVGLRQLQTEVSEQTGSTARVGLEVQTDRKSHRFVVPNVSLDALRGSLSAIAARYANAGLVADAPRKGFRLR